MKNDSTKVARLAAQARNPGKGVPGAAKAVEVEVDVALLAAAPDAVLAVELDVAEVTPNPSPVRVPTVVNTRALVLVARPVAGGYASQKVSKRVMTASVSGSRVRPEQGRERGRPVATYRSSRPGRRSWRKGHMFWQSPQRPCPTGHLDLGWQLVRLVGECLRGSLGGTYQKHEATSLALAVKKPSISA